MSSNKYTILVVEDDRNILSMIQTVLETTGYQVLTAQRCQQGILMFIPCTGSGYSGSGTAGYGW